MQVRELRLIVMIAIIVGMSACQTVGTLGPERLVLTPGLFPQSNLKRSESLSNDGLLKRQSISVYTENLEAMVAYEQHKGDKLGWDQGFTYSLKKIRLLLKRNNKFKNKTLVFGKKAAITTSLGKITYEYFSYDNKRCAHFTKPYHRHPMDYRGRYSSYLIGYICQTFNNTLDDMTVAAFLEQVSITR